METLQVLLLDRLGRTKRMLGRLTASQIASASLASFFCDFTYGFTTCGAISPTVCLNRLNASIPETNSALQSNQAGFQSGKERRHLGSSQPLPHDHPARPVHSVRLKYLLGNIQSHSHDSHREPPAGLSLQSSRMGPFH